MSWNYNIKMCHETIKSFTSPKLSTIKSLNVYCNIKIRKEKKIKLKITDWKIIQRSLRDTFLSPIKNFMMASHSKIKYKIKVGAWLEVVSLLTHLYNSTWFNTDLFGIFLEINSNVQTWFQLKQTIDPTSASWFLQQLPLLLCLDLFD